MEKITIAGCGPGSPDYLTAATVKAVEQARYLAGTRRLLDLFPGSAATRIQVGADMEKALNEIEQVAGKGKVVVLVTGDPGVFSLAGAVIRRFGRAACEVIPGVSSVQTAFARLCLDWHDARIVSAHSNIPDIEFDALEGEKKIAVLAGNAGSLCWAADLAERLGGKRRIFAAGDLTLEEESIREVTPGELRSIHCSPRTIVLILEAGLPGE